MARYTTKVKPKRKPKRSMTPIWLALAGVAILVVAGLAVLNNNQSKAAVEVKGAASLKVEKDKIDRGDQKLGTTIRDEIKITNVGDQPLRFSEAPYVEVKEGCWPPQPAIGSMVIQPGESTFVTLEYMMHGSMGGQHDFLLHLKTNDPAQADKTVDIRSNWIP